MEIHASASELWDFAPLLHPSKLKNKNLDMICANDVSDSSIGFNSENNAMTLFWPEGERHLSLQSKQQISHLILKEIASKLAAKK